MTYPHKHNVMWPQDVDFLGNISSPPAVKTKYNVQDIKQECLMVNLFFNTCFKMCTCVCASTGISQVDACL